MQLCNVIVRLAGNILHTVHKTDCTPAEVLILQHIHGTDAVVDIRPTGFDERRRSDEEFERLARFYDPAVGSGFGNTEEAKSIMATLFPGAMKKLPVTLAEIGLSGYDIEPAPKTKRQPKAAQVPAQDAEAAADAEGDA